MSIVVFKQKITSLAPLCTPSFVLRRHLQPLARLHAVSAVLYCPDTQACFSMVLSRQRRSQRVGAARHASGSFNA